MHAEHGQDFEAARYLLIEQGERARIIQAGTQIDAGHAELDAQRPQQVGFGDVAALDQNLSELAAQLRLQLRRLVEFFRGDRADFHQDGAQPARVGAWRRARTRAGFAGVDARGKAGYAEDVAQQRVRVHQLEPAAHGVQAAVRLEHGLERASGHQGHGRQVEHQVDAARGDA